MNIVFEGNPRKKIDRAYVAERMKQTLDADIDHGFTNEEADDEKKPQEVWSSSLYTFTWKPSLL